MRIGIIGNGVVGGTLRQWLLKNTYHTVVVYDPPQGHAEPIGKCDAAFIAVPVPTKSFKQDLSALKEAIRVAQYSDRIFVRSSVLPGTCDELSLDFGVMICAMPEFLTERTRDEDMIKQDLLIGVPKRYTDRFDEVEKALKQIFVGRKHCHFGLAAEAEFAKYAHNCFGAVKVTYYNALYDLAKKHKLDWDRVRKFTLASGYINDVHTQVPGPDGKTGFGGKCFPKDLAAFIGWVDSNPSYALLKDVLCLNRFYRGEKDFVDGTDNDQEAS